MADTVTTLRWSLQTYLVLLAGLGLFTVGWSLASALVFDDATLASAWFGVAGSGTVLVAVLLFRHVSVDESGPVI